MSVGSAPEGGTSRQTWSPAQVKAARTRMGLSTRQLAAVLGLSERTGDTTVRRWEMARHCDTALPITGPAQAAMMALSNGWRPVEFRPHCARADRDRGQFGPSV